MHILLIRFSSMGDIVLQTATINWLRSLLGAELKITFVTSKEFASLVENHPFVTSVISFDRRGGEKLNDLISKIKVIDSKEPIDLVLDLHANLRSMLLKFRFWTIPALTVDKRRWERLILVKFKNKFLKRILSKKVFGLEPQVERIIKDFEFIFGDLKALRRTQDFRKGPHKELTSLAELPTYPLPAPYIVIAPSASFKFKRWPIESFVALTEKLLEKTKFHFVVLAGPDDSFCSAFNSIQSERLQNLQGKTSLKESMSVIARASLCIGNDSGMNHIAEAYGVPCVTLFGPTDPLFGFAPHGENSYFLSKDLSCKPCSTTGSKDCFREQHYCMEMISVDEVIGTVMKSLDVQA